MHLLDVNALIAYSLEAHEHFHAVHRWIEARGQVPFATCAITESSLVRLLMNPAICPQPVDPASVLALIDQMHQHPSHRYLETLPSVREPSVREVLTQATGYRQITDAYLIAIARMNGFKLATLDRKLAEPFGEASLEIIPRD